MQAMTINRKGFICALLLQAALLPVLIAFSYTESMVKVLFFLSAFPFLVFFILASIKDTLYGYLLIIMAMPILNCIRGSRLALSFGDFYVVPLSYFVWMLFIVSLSVSLIRKNEQVKTEPEDRLWFFFALLGGLSIVSAFYIPTNIQKATLVYLTGIIEPLIIYYVLRIRLRSLKDVTTIVTAIFLSLCISCALGLVKAFPLTGGIQSLFLKRQSFTYSHPNIFAPVALLVLPLGFWLIWKSRHLLSKITFFLLAAGIFAAILLTGSRGGLLILVILLPALLFRREYRPAALSILGPASIAIARNPLVIFALSHRLLATYTRGRIVDSSALLRLEAWKLSFSIMKIYPFGVGGACFPYIWIKISQYPGVLLSCSHQLFLSIGTEFGVVPMVLFVILLCSLFYKCIKTMTISNDRSVSLLSFSLLVGLLGYVGYGILSEGQLSHLTAWEKPIHSHSIILFSLLSVVSFMHRRTALEAS